MCLFVLYFFQIGIFKSVVLKIKFYTHIFIINNIKFLFWLADIEYLKFIYKNINIMYTVSFIFIIYYSNLILYLHKVMNIYDKR
jgi:hypothetical protein